MTGDVDALDTVFLFVLAPLATALLAGAIMTAVLGYWIPAAALVFALALLVACVLAPWAAARRARAGAAAQESAAGLRAAVLDAVDGHADMVALHAQAQTRAHFERLCGQNAQARQAQACRGARALVPAGAGAAVLGVLWFGLGEHEGGGLSGPLLAGLLLAVMGIFEVAAPIMRGASRLGSAVSAAQRIREVAQCEPDMRDPDAPAALPADGALELDGLRFAYPDGALVLDGVSLRVAPGERVAIQGESGAGKSTLLHLILRLEDPQAGQVRYGGRDARDCAQADWHRRIALLSQDAPVFLGTLRTNLLIGDPSADEAALWRALDAARLGDFVRGLPDGLDAWAGETGSLLSAGQARRLCLARAPLSPARVLVLDEPTAGLDAAAEADFLRDLGRASQGRAVVLATHARLPAGAVDRRCVLRGDSCMTCHRPSLSWLKRGSGVIVRLASFFRAVFHAERIRRVHPAHHPQRSRLAPARCHARDITPVLQDPRAFRVLIDLFVYRYMRQRLDLVAGVDARGFIVGSVLAYELNLGFVPVRKKGKLPYRTVAEEYSLEYGNAAVEMHTDAVRTGQRVLLVDDLIATGGTMLAAIKLLQRLGANVVEAAAIIDLPDLGGSAKIAATGTPLYTVCQYQNDTTA